MRVLLGLAVPCGLPAPPLRSVAKQASLSGNDRSSSDICVLNALADCNVLAFRRGRGQMAQLFSRCSIEDGVILLLAMVRVAFHVRPEDWSEWKFLTVPLNDGNAVPPTVFRIDATTGWPMKMSGFPELLIGV